MGAAVMEATDADGGGGAPAPEVLLEVTGQVATITMNRPEARNMLTASGMGLLAAHLRAAGADPSVRVIVLTGSGNTFCSGADLRGASAADAASFTGSGPAALVEVLGAILDNPKPVIARVQGHVAGGGNGLVAAADLSVAAESAKFAFSEVRLGLAPAVISVVCLARMHRADAQELLLTGDRVPAARMVGAGMVNRVVADEGLDAAVDAWVAALMAGGPEALTHTKDLLRVVPGMSREKGFAHTATLSAQLFASPEAAAGMMAFLTRQPAPWIPQS
ncbi:MAG TPA: enoyl-CoA hydratase-related protein [Motilibacterales bacterium]|nr:enoyl-CoA hydratase-related protein [Motilibacterales bacterium]